MTEIEWTGNGILALAVANLDASMKWYVDVLGCRVTTDLRPMGWCEVSAPVSGVRFGLQAVERFPGAQGGATPMFEVKDIVRARQHLENKDVRFEVETFTVPGVVTMATFFDPTGNALKPFQTLS